IEYTGPGVATLSVPQRATVCNMGAELGATTSLFPSDEATRAYLKAQAREADYVVLAPDEDAVYDEEYTIDLTTLEPFAACPHSPDKVVPITQLSDIVVEQVCIGSCTNSSYTDLMAVASILKGRTVAPTVSLVVSPGSRQVLEMISKNGALADILSSGARLLECACGPCIGMGQSPASGAVSVRTFNRNFEGRSGTKDAQVYLVSPETAAVTAIYGKLTDPRILKDVPVFSLPEHFEVNDNMIDLPATEEESVQVEIERGPNIKPLPVAKPLADELSLPALLKVGDNITTDHIMPAGAKILPYRSNIPHLAQYCFEGVDPSFPERALQAANGGFIIGGQNYGQGSSREHAALVPLYLGIRAVIVQSFARIHKANLVNAGLLPLEFENADDLQKISEGDELELSGIFTGLESGHILLINKTTGQTIPLLCSISPRQATVIKAGGLLNYTREQNAAK
ncbi:MAG: aconitate hydratase, partial [Oscillospiraceae bacterium]